MREGAIVCAAAHLVIHRGEAARLACTMAPTRAAFGNVASFRLPGATPCNDSSPFLPSPWP